MPFPGNVTGVSAPDQEPEPAVAGVSAPAASSPVLSPNMNETMDRVALYGIPGMGVGLLDTMGQSVGLFKNDSVQNTLNNVIGPNGFSDYYSRNRPALRALGETAGMFIPGMVGLKVLKGVRMAREGLGAVSLLNNGSKFSAAADVLLGSSAELTSLEAGIGKAGFAATQDSGIIAGKTFSTAAVADAKKAYYTARLMDSVRNTAVFEASTRTLYNKSEMFFPADYTLSDQAKWGVAGLVGGAALDLAVGRYAVRSILKAQAATALAAKPDVVRDASNVLFRAGDRGPGLAQMAAQKNYAQNAIDAAANPTLAYNSRQDINSVNSVLKKNIEAMAVDPHPILPKAQLTPEQVELGINALQKNETSFLFATKLGQLPPDQEQFYKDINEAKTAATQKLNVAQFQGQSITQKDPVKGAAFLDKALSDFNELNDAAHEIHYVIEPDARINVYSNRAPNWLDNNSFSDIKRSTYQTETSAIDPNTGKLAKVGRSKLTVGGATPLTLHDDFRIELPQNTNPDAVVKTPALSQEGYSALYAATSKMIQEWTPAVGQRFPLNEGLPWRQTEATLALANAHPEAEALIDYTGDFSNAKDAMFHVLDQKYQEFNTLMDKVERQPITAPAALLRSTKITPAQVFQRLNMPDNLLTSTHPMVNTFAAARLEGQTNLRDMLIDKKSLMPQEDHPLDLFRQAMKESTDDGELAPHTQVTVGPLLTQGTLDKNGNVMNVPPVFVAAKSTPSLSFADTKIHAMLESRRDLQMARLAQIDPNTAPLVSMVGQNVAGNPAGTAARNVQSLHDGLFSGHANVVSLDRITEQSSTLKAVQLIAQDTDKKIDDYVAALSRPVLTPKVGSLLKPNNKAGLFDFNRIEQSYRHGWDIKRIEPAPNGGVRFALNDTKMNDALVAKYFAGHDVPDEAKGYMPDMSVGGRKIGYIPLTVSPEAGDVASEISKMSRQSGIENNALRVALGLRSLKIRDFHLPTPELFKEGTWFIRNSAGDVIATYTGDTENENHRRALADAAALIASTKEPHIVASMQEVQHEHSVFDRNFQNVINYGDQLAKSGAAIKGGLAHATIDTGPQTLIDMVKSLHQQFMSVGVRTRAAVFEPELNYARQASQVAAPLGDKIKNSNVFDMYTAAMFSRSVAHKDSAFKAIYNPIEDVADRMITWAMAHVLQGSSNTKVVTDGKGLQALLGRNSTENEMAQFKHALSDFSPFEDTQDWLDSTYKQAIQPSARKYLAGLSKVSSTMSLRFLDAGSAVNNLLGDVTALPAVVSSMRRLSNESEEEWLGRTAAWGSRYTQNTMTFSPSKAMANAARMYWNGDLAGPMKEAASMGYFKTEYAALADVLTNPAHGGKGQIEKWTDYASYLADHSEILSRKIAWGVGYSIAKDLHQFEDKRSIYLFANNFVNETIGNYAANNKPAMFQGAVGLPLGAFQTWMFNFYRRMYGYIERGDIKSLGAQYATQASLFGAKSVPGFGLWNQFMMTSENGADDTSTRIERKLPSGVRELLLNGSLSGIPAIFGASNTPAFYSRGSVDMTAPPPTLLDASKAPPIQFLVNTYKGVVATIDNIFGAGHFSVQQQEEILANFTTNRALKSLMEYAANAKTDQRGDVIEYGTRDAIHVASAVLGANTSNTRHLQEAYSHQQAVEVTQSDLRAKLNDHTRALMRGGEFGVSDLQDVVKDYVGSGGNPAYIGEWLRNTEATSVTPKAQAKMEELGRSGKWLEFMNMLATMQH